MPRKKQLLCAEEVVNQPLENGNIKGKVRRTKKPSESFKSSLSKILSLKIAPDTVAKSVLKTPLGDNITYQEAILIAQILKAANGDTQAATYIRDTSGNKLKEKEAEKIFTKKFEDF